MKIKPMPKEEKLREAAMLNAAIARAGMKKTEFAEKIGYSSTDISQWFNQSNPTKIPDLAYCKAAAMLGFDPSASRPYLKDMYASLSEVFSQQAPPPSTAEILLSVIEMLPDDERAAFLDKMRKQ